MNTFGPLLRDWRGQRRYSQLDLALAAETSARHISFLESGRANPSRDMVMRLANTLAIPRAEVNTGLVCAGFAPVYPQLDRDAESLNAIRRAIDTMLVNHSPWPALACDSQWNLLQANPAAVRLIDALNAQESTNIMQLMLTADAPDGPLLNWPEVARLVLARLQAEQIQRPNESSICDLKQRLQQHPRINEGRVDGRQELGVVVPMRVRTAEATLSLFSMIAQFGSVQEVTMADVRIELFFPEDDVTAEYFSSLSIS